MNCRDCKHWGNGKSPNADTCHRPKWKNSGPMMAVFSESGEHKLVTSAEFGCVLFEPGRPDPARNEASGETNKNA